MEKFQAALISDASKQIAVIAIDKKTVENEELMKKMVKFFKQNIFPDCEIALMYLNENKKPLFYGTKDIVHELNNTLWKRLPWKEYALGKNISF